MPSKRTDAAKAVILETLRRSGSTRKAAYTAAGMSHETFALWLREDEAFAQEVEEAEQDAVTEALSKIKALGMGGYERVRTVRKKQLGLVIEETVETEVAEGNLGALTWWLERRHPAEFGKRLDVTSGGERLPPATVLIGLPEIDDDELDRRIAQAQGGEAPPDLPA